MYIYIYVTTSSHRCQEYEELRKDPTIRFPEKHMLQATRQSGQYQGCFSESHWGKKRRLEKWDLFCEVAPKLAKRCYELPNRVKTMLNIDCKLKHSNSRFKQGENHSIPTPLTMALEDILIERMQFGEEVTFDFAQDVLKKLLDLWNEKVVELREKVNASLGTRMLAEQDSAIDDATTEDQLETLHKSAMDQIEDALSNMTVTNVSGNSGAMRILVHIVVDHRVLRWLET